MIIKMRIQVIVIGILLGGISLDGAMPHLVLYASLLQAFGFAGMPERASATANEPAALQG